MTQDGAPKMKVRKAMSLDLVLARMRERIRTFGSQKKWADHIQCSETFVSLVLNKQRSPTQRILTDIHVRIEPVYVDTYPGGTPKHEHDTEQ